MALVSLLATIVLETRKNKELEAENWRLYQEKNALERELEELKKKHA
jgi:cell division protein FtsB